MDKNEVKRITTTLGNNLEKDRFYVYMLCSKSTKKPFYIGKGVGDRIWAHEKNTKDFEDSIKKELKDEILANNNSLSPEEINNLIETRLPNDKCTEIAKLLKSNNFEPVIIKYGLTEDEALMAESSLINAYSYTNGRSSLTNILNGHTSTREKENIAHETKARSIEDFLIECACNKVKLSEISAKIILININKSYLNCKGDPQKIYESAQSSWIIAKKRRDVAEYVFALFESQIVGIYKVDKNHWLPDTRINEHFPKNKKSTNKDNYYYFWKADEDVGELGKYLHSILTDDDDNNFKMSGSTYGRAISYHNL